MPGRNVLILYSFITATACAIADGQAPTQQANALEMERRGRYEEAAIASSSRAGVGSAIRFGFG